MIRASGVSDEEAYFWAVHGQADLDLLLFRRGARLGYEVKYTDRPADSRSLALAQEHLRLDRLTIVIPGDADYFLTERIRVQGLATVVAAFHV